MNEARKQRHRVPSDFSIARILANDRSARSTVGSDIGDPSYPRFRASVDAATASINEASGHRRVLTTAMQPLEDASRHEKSHCDRSSLFVRTACAPGNVQGNELAWLSCTRYRPPRLPRKPSSVERRNATAAAAGKRRPGVHPRIPFSTLQLKVLEEKYGKSAYLSRRDVIQLSAMLRLPQTRVKIWFQNRRARERRESRVASNDGSRRRDFERFPSSYNNEESNLSEA